MHLPFKQKKLVQPTKKKPLNFIARLLFCLLTISTTSLLVSCTQAKTSSKLDSYNYPIAPDRSNIEFMKIQLQGSIALRPTKVDSLPVHELSGLAWDEDEQLLYAVSDEGLLYHLRVNIIDNKLQALKIVAAMQLKDIEGVAIRGKYSDSEDLSLLNGNNGKKGDSELIISFENKPRIIRYSTQGKFLKKVKIPKKLRKRKYYRNKNKALESVTTHPKYGILTAAEYPLKSHPITQQTIYSSSGKEWHFPAAKERNSAITSLEVLPNGDILILERAYVNLFTPIAINLSRLKLDQCDKKNVCKKESIARLSGADGWLLDNFEGLSHYRGNQYFLVSDNNKNPLQKTILMLFKVL